MPLVDPLAVGMGPFITMIYLDWHNLPDPNSPPLYTDIVEGMIHRIQTHRGDVKVDVFDDEYGEVQAAWRAIQGTWTPGTEVHTDGFMSVEWSDPFWGASGVLMDQLGMSLANIFEQAYATMMEAETARNPGWEKVQEDTERRRQERKARELPENVWELPDDDAAYQYFFN
jgi:hypothetical protein